MKKVTKKFWEDFVKKNADNSYSLVVCLIILILWEHGVKTEDEAHTVLQDYKFGLSGAQAGMAINYALNGQPTNWLDKSMVKISREKN